MGKGSLHYKQPPSEVPLPKSVALAGGCLCIRMIEMALEGNIRLLEKDIEDWLWLHPEIISFVDGWIDRQLPLSNNTILDMLGYKNFHGRPTLVLVELKSRSLREKDVLQIGKYVTYLQYTIEDIGLISLNIWPVLIGVNTGNDRRLWESAMMINAMLYDVALIDGNMKLVPVSEPKFDYKEKAISMYQTGRYDNLIQYLLPEMPDFMQDEYKYKYLKRSEDGTR